jgi:uncharacterized protein Usg
VPKNYHKISSGSFGLSRGYATEHSNELKVPHLNEQLDEANQIIDNFNILRQFKRFNNDYLNNLVESMAKEGDIEMTTQDWQEIDGNMAENFDKNSTFGKFWPTQIMGFFHSQQFSKRAKSLLDYVTIETAHVSILKHYMQLCTRMYCSEQKEDIFRIYNTLKPKIDLLDFDTLSVILIALCKTEKWQESLDLLKMLETLEVPTPQQFSSIAGAAIQAGDFETLDSMLDQMGAKCYSPNKPRRCVYTETLKIKDLEISYKMIQIVFKYMSKYAWYSDQYVADEMKGWFENNKLDGVEWKVNTTKVNRR